MKGSWPWNKDYSKQKQGVLYLGVHLFLCTYASPRYSIVKEMVEDFKIKEVIINETQHHPPFPREICCPQFQTGHHYESMKEFALAESRSNEEMAFLDYDYWCYCQDFKDLKFENIKVTEVKDGKATVSLDLYNFGTKHSRILEMAFERGDWYIDNIIDFDGNSREDFMQGIRDYIDSMK